MLRSNEFYDIDDEPDFANAGTVISTDSSFGTLRQPQAIFVHDGTMLLQIPV